MNHTNNSGVTPMLIACRHVIGSSPPTANAAVNQPRPSDTAEHLAAFGESPRAHPASRLWTTPLHRLEVLTRARARALRDGPTSTPTAPTSIAAAAPGEGGVPQTPLDRAKLLCMRPTPPPAR